MQKEFCKLPSDKQRKFIVKNLLKDALEQNKDISDQYKEIVEQNKETKESQEKLFDLVEKQGKSSLTINTQNNTQNNHFNLNFFLNETCKDAMNLSEFVDSLQITLADLENVGKL